MRYYEVITALAYLSLFIELTVFHVPSQVSVVSEKLASAVSPLKAVLDKLVRLLFVAVCILTLIYPLMELVFNLGFNPEPTELVGGLGATLMVVGRAITTVAVFTIRVKNSQRGDDFFLHTEGLYRYSRNPIQLGMYLFLIGAACVYWNPIFLAGIAVYFAYMHVILLREEHFLLSRFKQDYAEYLKRTARYF